MAPNSYNSYYLLIWKNVIIKLRHKKELIIEILVPLLFCGLLILLRKLATQTFVDQPTIFEPVFIDNFSSSRLSLDYGYNYKFLAYTPQNQITDAIVQNAGLKLEFPTKGFNNSQDMETYMILNNIFFGIVFNSLHANYSTNDLDFTIRVPPNFPNRTEGIIVGWDTTRYHKDKLLPGPLDSQYLSSSGGQYGYIYQGLATIQYTISNAFITVMARLEGKKTNLDLPEIVMQRFPYPPYLQDPILEILNTLLALIFIISFSYSVSQTVKHVTAEKEKQLTETMRIMGLKTVHHWTSWFLTSYMLIVIISCIVVLVLKIPLINNTAVLPASNSFILFLFLLCYGASIITFAFFVSSLFTKPAYAGSMASVLFFLFYVPYTFTLNSVFTPSKTVSTALCLMMNTAMSFGFKSIIQWERAMEGVQFYNLFRNTPGITTVSTGVAMLMLLFDSVLYMLLTLYIEKVFPGQHGVKHKWNFFCRKQYWMSHKYSNMVTHHVNGSNDIDPDRFEDDPANAGKRIGIRIKDLRKTFGHKVAVDGLSLDMYDDEITVLLGHNGAGKTTTISMITGFLMPTSGSIEVNGIDTSENMQEIRKSLGICPQHNILFDDLTVEEHITFYCRLKGQDPNELTGEIEKYLRMLQLEDKRNALVKTLSGGMKRKLSLGVALCGGSKVVLCDEPSSGMDPEARRELWNLLEREKKGRTILLTTHFMDEADILGDRIAIMSGGRLRCVGTSFFLKKKFGTGYQLICNKTPDCNPENVTALINKHIPSVMIKNNVGSELSYNLPESSVPAFEALLAELEESQKDLCINGYGISMTTLEDVFMRTGSEIHSTVYKDSQDTNSTVSIRIREDTALRTNKQRYWYQWEAMFFKKFICMRRNWIIPTIQILLPILVLSFVLQDISIGNASTMPKMELDLDNYGQTNTLLSTVQNSSVVDALRNMYSVMKDKHKLVRVDGDMIPAIVGLDKKATTFDGKSDYVVANSFTSRQLIAWFNHEIMHTVPMSLSLIQNAVAKAFLGKDFNIRVSIHPLPFNVDSTNQKAKDPKAAGFQMASNLSFTMPIVSAMFLLFLIKERVSKAKLLQFSGGVPPFTYWFSHLLVDMIGYVLIGIGIMLVCFIVKVDDFSSSEALGSLVLIFILYGLASLPFTYLLSFVFQVPATGMSRSFLINLIAGMGFFIAMFIMRITMENENTINIVRAFFLILPSYGLSEAISNEGTYYMMKKLCAVSSEKFNVDASNIFVLLSIPGCVDSLYAWEYPGIGATLFALAFCAVFYFTLLIVVETYKRRMQNIKNVCRPKFPPRSNEIDHDVEEEKLRVENMTTTNLERQTLVMQRLTKFYKKFLAVNNLSVAVEPGECFGLLGVNGAGKTSAFKMLTGDENISYGEVWIEGNNAQTDMSRIYEMIGYCPQFDALLLEMTGFELLKMFCLIHGIDKRSIAELVERLATDLAFDEYLYRRTEGYSGGNRRKLNTAIALLGDPHIIYLDEPTSGIDPASRRKLWDMICLMRASGKGIILTSHSMEECEALCTRVAIMVNGEFKCLGSTQHLKNKFSKTISLTVKLKKFESSRDVTDSVSYIANEMKMRENKVVDFIVESFPGAVLKESRLRLLTFEIPLNIMKYSRIFGLMEANRADLNVEDYSLTQASLEQIFLQFARQQRTDDKKPNK